MDTVTVKKAELLSKLKKNKESHTQLYKDAMEGFFVETEKRLNKALLKLNAKVVPNSISIASPYDHTEQYEEAIALLEMSVDEEIELTSHEFNNCVLDRWINQSEKTRMVAMALSSSNSSLYK